MTTAPGPLPPGQPRAVFVSTVAHGLDHLEERARVLVACSGGADSTALAFLTAEARPDLDLSLVHVRHGLRDDTVDRTVVARHASWLGVPLVTRDVEVRPSGHGVEAAARDARYAALREVAAEMRAVAILVGHTADDQAETVLLRLARGTGTDGLRAMSAVAGDLVRPLLSVRRSDVRRFVTLEGLPVAEDESNQDPAIRRVRVRQEVLPALERIAPDPVGALHRLADLARDDAAALELAAAPLRSATRWIGPSIACLPAATLAEAPVSLARRAVRDAIGRLTGQAPPAAEVTRVLAAPPGYAASLPGRVELTVDRVWRTLAHRTSPTAEPTKLEVPGTTSWAPAGLELRAITPEDPVPVEAPASQPTQIALPLTGAWSPPRPRIDPRAVPVGGVATRMTVLLPDDLGVLTLRHRRPGDRILLGAGTRRLADVHRDAGLPRPARAVWPVLVADDRVVWIPGLAVDAELAARGRTDPALLVVASRHAGR